MVKHLLKRDRHPGDLIFAACFLLLSLFLLSRLGYETSWVGGTAWYAQPMLWPALSLAGMTAFALINVCGAVVSDRREGRGREMLLWCRSTEYACWFMLYVWIVPLLGYLPATVIFAASLAMRTGYRDRATISAAVLVGIAIVVVFKGVLEVKIPAGQVYEHLPDGLHNFMIQYM